MLPVEVVGAIRARTHERVAVKLNDASGLAVSIASGSVEPKELLEFAFDGTVRRDALEARADLALSGDEFASLFGAKEDGSASSLCTFASKKIAEVDASSSASSMRKRIEGALVCTLNEAAPAAIWKRHPGVRLAAVVALHRQDDATEALSAVLGGVVSADRRRVEDLKIGIEDEGVDLIFASDAIQALSESVLI
jgi:hypothetical protein